MPVKSFLKNIYWGMVRIKDGNGFHSFGNKSYIIKPDRIIGKRYIDIGGGVSILHHCRIEAVKTYNGENFNPHIIIEDNVSIEENAHIIGTGMLKICKGATISGNVFITDCWHDYTDIDKDVLQQGLHRKDTYIGENSFIGFGAVVMAGVKLGKQCIVGANAVVIEGDYPDYSVLVGTPARVIKMYNHKTCEWEKIDV